MQDEQHLEYFRRHHGFDEWRGRNKLDENLFVWRFYPGEDELPGLKPQRVQAVAAPPGRPAAIQSLWSAADNSSEALVRADTFECASRLAAHEFLLEALGQFQSPLVERRENAGGDVAFSIPGDTAVLLARANLVVMLRNAGREVMPLDATALRFDASLIRGPEEEKERRASDIQRFELPDAESKQGVDLLMRAGLLDLAEEPAERSPQQPWYKFFSRTGEVSAEGGRLVYRSTTPGPQAVTTVVIPPGRSRHRRAPDQR